MNIGNFLIERTFILSEIKWISIYGDNEIWKMALSKSIMKMKFQRTGRENHEEIKQDL